MNMCNYFKKSLLLLLLFVSGIVQAQNKTERIIRNMLDAQTASWNRGDLEGFMNGYWESDSLLFIGISGPNYGWRTTLLNYKKSYPDTVAMGKLHFDIIKIEKISGRSYNVVGRWFLTRSIGNLQGVYTLLLKKINGGWVIVQDHSS